MERLPSRYFAAALLLTASSAIAQSTALIGATVIDGTGRPGVPNAVIVVTGERLTCVGTAVQCPVPAGARRVDVTGRFVTPALVDAHVHFGQTGWLDGRPDLIDASALYPYAETQRALRDNPARWYRSYLCSGVTAVYDVGGPPWTTTLPTRAEHDSMAPHVRAAGVESTVHASDLRAGKSALKAGAVMLVHGVDDEPLDDEFLTLLQTTRAIYTPTLLAERNGVRAFASIILGARYPIDDPGRCVDSNTVAKTAAVAPLRLLVRDFGSASERMLRDLDDPEGRGAMLADNLRRAYASGATIVVGTDAGSPLTFHGASIFSELEAMQAAGLPAADIVVMATRNGAQAMGRLKDFGTLEAGKLADLLILAEDPRRDVRAFRSLTHVMRAGRLYEQAALAQRN